MKMKKGNLTFGQWAILLVLCADKHRDALHARLTKTKNKRGWSHISRSMCIKPFKRSIPSLWKKGLIESCCAFHAWHELVRISESGERALGPENVKLAKKGALAVVRSQVCKPTTV